jgi:hypothetical protein
MTDVCRWSTVHTIHTRGRPDGSSKASAATSIFAAATRRHKYNPFAYRSISPRHPSLPNDRFEL